IAMNWGEEENAEVLGAQNLLQSWSDPPEAVYAFSQIDKSERRRVIRRVRRRARILRFAVGLSLAEASAQIAREILNDPDFSSFCEQYASLVSVVLLAALAALVQEIVKWLCSLWRD